MSRALTTAVLAFNIAMSFHVSTYPWLNQWAAAFGWFTALCFYGSLKLKDSRP